MADQLAPQDGLYTLITRGAAGDDFRLIGSLAAVHPSTDHAAYLDYLRRSEVAVSRSPLQRSDIWLARMATSIAATTPCRPISRHFETTWKQQ
jgi:hypothetical protein